MSVAEAMLDLGPCSQHDSLMSSLRECLRIGSVALLAAVGLAGESATRPAVSPAAAARTFIDLLGHGEFQQAVGRFDSVMAERLPAEKLEQVWGGLVARLGPLKGTDEGKVLRHEKYIIVLVPSYFQKGRLQTKVVFDQEERVTGLWFQPMAQSRPYVPPVYVDPSRFKEGKIVLRSGGYDMPGVLTLPKAGGKLSGVVLIHGSGPHDRDESIGANKPFRDLAWGLATRGVAVLRYDKRTLVQADKPGMASVTVQEEVIADAVKAIELLRRQRRVDAQRVFLLGHSLGAMLAPEIAHKSGRVAGVIMLAGSARPVIDGVLEQLEYILSLPGGPKDQAGRRLEEIRASVRAIEERKMRPGEVFLGAPARYWYDLSRHDGQAAVQAARALKRPTLIIQGGRDYQVTLADFGLWKVALADRRDVTFKLFADLNHLFIPGKGKSTPAEYQTPGHVDVRVVDTISTWIKANHP